MIKRLSISFIKTLLISTIISFIMVFGLNHFGKFSCLYDYNSPPRSDGKLSFTEQIPINTKISVFYFESFFGNKTSTNGGNWTGADFNFESDFWKYSNKCVFYFKGTLSDKEYILYISILLTFILFIYYNFRDLKLLISKLEFKKNKTNTVLYLIILLLLFSYGKSFTENKLLENKIYDLENKIAENENEIANLEEENENLKNQNTLYEERIKITEEEKNYDREYNETRNLIAENDGMYYFERNLPYSLIKNTDFEKFIIKNDDNENIRVKIIGNQNMLNFLDYISQQYVILYRTNK